MIWTGWNNGRRHPTGAGYGFKIEAVDRDRNFKAEWHSVTVELPTHSGIVTVEVNVGKQSFWADCRELISEGIGRWMLDQCYAPWPTNRPPKFEVEESGPCSFRIKGPVGLL